MLTRAVSDASALRAMSSLECSAGVSRNSGNRGLDSVGNVSSPAASSSAGISLSPNATAARPASQSLLTHRPPSKTTRWASVLGGVSSAVIKVNTIIP